MLLSSLLYLSCVCRLQPRIQRRLAALWEPAVLPDIDALAEPRNRLDDHAFFLEPFSLPEHAEPLVAARRYHALGRDDTLR